MVLALRVSGKPSRISGVSDWGRLTLDSPCGSHRGSKTGGGSEVHPRLGKKIGPGHGHFPRSSCSLGIGEKPSGSPRYGGEAVSGDRG